jgi:hypothetical protein
VKRLVTPGLNSPSRELDRSTGLQSERRWGQQEGGIGWKHHEPGGERKSHLSSSALGRAGLLAHLVVGLPSMPIASE